MGTKGTLGLDGVWGCNSSAASIEKLPSFLRLFEVPLHGDNPLAPLGVEQVDCLRRGHDVYVNGQVTLVCDEVIDHLGPVYVEVTDGRVERLKLDHHFADRSAEYPDTVVKTTLDAVSV